MKRKQLNQKEIIESLESEPLQEVHCEGNSKNCWKILELEVGDKPETCEWSRKSRLGFYIMCPMCY